VDLKRNDLQIYGIQTGVFAYFFIAFTEGVHKILVVNMQNNPNLQRLLKYCSTVPKWHPSDPERRYIELFMSTIKL